MLCHRINQRVPRTCVPDEESPHASRQRTKVASGNHSGNNKSQDQGSRTASLDPKVPRLQLQIMKDVRLELIQLAVGHDLVL